ncbi:YbaK/EbsC family protein [Vandammella animalimorsus]|uniref:YbaK/EbsC family protein n=1 Tax=Vandammella animalimorsus TaxID=2029117 RepID=UPI001EEF111B|nr:YbaK/EbsC family protein [Vandammella animalimorsus]
MPSALALRKLPAAVTQPLPARLPEPVRRVQQALRAWPQLGQPQWLGRPARSLRQAAALLGVAPGQLARGVVLRRLADDAPVLVMAAGDRQVDRAKVSRLLGETARADARFVRERTGFAAGAVAPLGHREPVLCLLDESLQRFDALGVWCGHARALLMLSPAQLHHCTDAPWADVVRVSPRGLPCHAAIPG